MKKILLINTSNRKKNTYKLLSSVDSLLKAQNFETEIISLSDYKIDFCRGCECCILKNKCFINDDCNLLMDKIVDCDGLVIGAPVYMNNMPGILKTFLDRTCKWFHRSEVYQKPVLLLANTQGSGITPTLNSIKEAMIQWGVCLCGEVSRNGRSFNTPISHKEISKFVAFVNCNGSGYKPSLKEISTYNVQRALATNVFDIDKDYWDKNELINSSYFPQSKVSYPKKLYGNLLYRILCKSIKPHNS